MIKRSIFALIVLLTGLMVHGCGDYSSTATENNGDSTDVENPILIDAQKVAELTCQYQGLWMKKDSVSLSEEEERSLATVDSVLVVLELEMRAKYDSDDTYKEFRDAVLSLLNTKCPV